MIDGYSSTISLNSVTIPNIEAEEYVIRFSQTQFRVINMTITGISNPSKISNALIFGTTESLIEINGLSYDSSESSLLMLRNVTGSISQLSVSSVSSIDYLVQLNLWFDLLFQELTFSNVSSLEDNIVHIEKSVGVIFSSIQFAHISQSVMRIDASTSMKVTSLSILNCNQGISLRSGSSVTIINSTVNDAGNNNTIYGGAIYSMNSNLTVDSSVFLNSKAQTGGSLALLWSTYQSCAFSISNSSFTNNTALVKGGAIFYDLYRPQLKDNEYSNNQAEYGDNIASYPIQIKLKDSSSENIRVDEVASGQVIKSELEFYLVDRDDQIISIDNESSVKITSSDNSTNVKGTVETVFKNGIALFSNLILQAQPGSANVAFRIDSPAIDKDVIRLLYGSTLNQGQIIASFRNWESGEIEQDNEWIIWSAGTYALESNATEWHSWMDNAIWLGGKEIHVDSGYYRLSQHTSHIVECIRETSWKGGYIDADEHPVNCKEGHLGVLWAQCVVNDDVKYASNSNLSCSKWPSMALSILRFVGLCLAVLMFFVILVIVNIKKTGESQTSTLLRIMTNYLQIMTTALSINSNFPSILTDLFTPAEKVGSSSESFVSFEWFIVGSEMKAFTTSVTLFKIFLTAFLPLVLIVLFSIAWLVVYFVFKKWEQDLKRNMVVCSVVILFLLHPTLTRAGFGVFQCVEVDKDEYRVRADLDLKWYSSEHIQWCAFLGLPILIVWGIGIPATGLTILIKNKNRLGDWSTQKYMLMLYQGLKLDRYYWEFVNTLRKILLLSITVILATTSIDYQALWATIIMIIMLIIQNILNPYKLEINNKIEQLEILTGSSTLLASIVYQDKNNIAWIDLLVFITIIILNANFLFKWVYNMVKAEKDRYECARILTDAFEYCLWLKKKVKAKKVLHKRKHRAEDKKISTHDNTDQTKAQRRKFRNVLEDSLAFSKSNTNYKNLLNTYNEVKHDIEQPGVSSDSSNSLAGLRQSNEEEMHKTHNQKFFKIEDEKHESGHDKSIKEEPSSSISIKFIKKQRKNMERQDASVSYIDDSHLNDQLHLYEIHDEHKEDKF